MRALPKRLVPIFGRWGSLLLVALLIYVTLRIPFSRSSGSRGKVLGPAAAAQGARDQKAQGPAEPARYVKRLKPETPKHPPIQDHFPYLTANGKAPPIPENHMPPNPHVGEATPLLVGFTRDWPLLLQCVSSYIAAGWPPSDIYVVENTGAFGTNQRHEFTLQNPFFLNHTALHQLGVNVLMTPTLLNFAQLQNFYLHTALMRQWRYYFWSHQDIIVFSDQDVRKKDRDHDWDHDPFATLYERAIGLMRYLNGPDMPAWATHFFSYDHFTLVNRDAYLDVGAWDVHIPYYASDCDMYLRLHWAGYWQPQSEAGLVFDVDVAMNDIGAIFQMPGSHAGFSGDPVFRPPSMNARPHREAELKREQNMYNWVEKEGEAFQHLVEVAERMQAVKWATMDAPPSNIWQPRQSSGQSEPFYRDLDGFGASVDIISEAGRRVFADKWGHRGCDLLPLGIIGKEAWKLERDWDNEVASGGNWTKGWNPEPSKKLANLGIA